MTGFGAEVRYDDGSTALHHAAVNGHLEAVRALTELGADLHAVDNSRFTALALASQNGYPVVVRFLAERVAAAAAEEAQSARAARVPTGPSHVNPTRPKSCAQCGTATPRRGLKFISCGRCVAVRYCRRVCQARHWTAQHHVECVAREL